MEPKAEESIETDMRQPNQSERKETAPTAASGYVVIVLGIAGAAFERGSPRSRLR